MSWVLGHVLLQIYFKEALITKINYQIYQEILGVSGMNELRDERLFKCCLDC